MAFGIYVHIPYCLQLCSYCDFAKYDWQKIMPPAQYTDLLKREIKDRAPAILKADPARADLDTVYFGGGTPSLFDPYLILSILDELANAGFKFKQTRTPTSEITPEITTEITMEINPATVDQKKLDAYFRLGVNRFSVGAQTFHDRLLKKAGREHTAQDTVETLELLQKNHANFSFDLLFALPTQTLDELRDDVARALSFHPSHLSAYYLTVPEGHAMNKNRAEEPEQVEMFRLIENDLRAAGIQRYEISNFAKPGFESKHNLLYWTDQDYWGLGVSAHSYLRDQRYGTRFSNPAQLPLYEKQILAGELPSGDLVEPLLKHEALTDFCHTSLRLMRGLDENALRLKFGDEALQKTLTRLKLSRASGWVESAPPYWRLSENGRLLANQVFAQLTFLKGEAGALTSDESNP